MVLNYNPCNETTYEYGSTVCSELCIIVGLLDV